MNKAPLTPLEHEENRFFTKAGSLEMTQHKEEWPQDHLIDVHLKKVESFYDKAALDHNWFARKYRKLLAHYYKLIIPPSGKPGGTLCFTVPIIVGRLTRNRDGLPKSFHGAPETAANDMVVHTEFGADAWTCVMEAGFTDVSIHVAAYPAAIAFAARNGWLCL